MVETNELQTEIGTEESANLLTPKNVKIENVRIEEVETAKKSKKVVFEVKHPDSEALIHISSVKYEKVKGKLEVVGLWLNKDTKNKIRKGSSLAIFLNSVGSKTPEEAKGKEVPTIQDDKGYLVFKAY